MITQKHIDYALTLPGDELLPRLFKASREGKMTSQDVAQIMRAWLASHTSVKSVTDLAEYAEEIGI